MSGEEQCTARCEILIIGSEFTAGSRVDTNSAWLRRQLQDLDVEVARTSVLPDRVDEIATAAAAALRRADLVLVTGGLGPTGDDRTLLGLARATGRRLVRAPQVAARLRELGRRRGRRLSSSILRQADLPEGGRPLPNERGSAPGVWLEHQDALLVALPGVPGEMRAIYRQALAGPLCQRFGASRLRRALLRVGGRWESQVDDAVATACDAAGVERTILATAGVVELHLSGTPAGVSRAVGSIRRLLGEDLITAEGHAPEEVVLATARRLGGTVAVAESCTGGRIAARLTSVPGASAVFLLGLVTYTDAAKRDWLGVPAETLAVHGAVSEATAQAMVRGLLRRTSATWGLAVTGVAGPAGGSADKPVGTVWFACSGPGGESARRHRLDGGRSRVQETAAGIGLDLLRRIMTPACGS